MCMMPGRELPNKNRGCISLTNVREGCRVLRDLTIEAGETL